MPEPRLVGGLDQVEIVKLMYNLRAKVYPWMRILHKLDGTVVVTIRPMPGEGGRD